MDITLKKRIVGFLLLVGIVLIAIPLFFGRSIPSDELKLSGHVPAAPPQPSNITVAIPPRDATVPPVARSPAPSILSSTDNAMPLPAMDQATKPSAVPDVAVAAAPSTNATVAASKPAAPVLVKAPVVAPTAQKPAAAIVAKPHAPAASQQTLLAVPKNPLKKIVHPLPAGVEAWAIQLGSFAQKANAEKLTKKLQAKGFTAYMSTRPDGATKVLVGPHLHHADAEQLKTRIQQEFDIQGVLVKTG